MVEVIDGDYVLYSETQALQAERDRLREALEDIAESTFHDDGRIAANIARKVLKLTV